MNDTSLLGLSIISNFNVFVNFHVKAIEQIEIIKNENEKLKLIDTIKIVYQNAKNDIISKFLNEPKFNPLLGSFISTLIKIALNEKFFKIKTEILDIINIIICKLKDSFQIDKNGVNPSDLMASYLPGISQFILKTIISDDNQNKLIYINSLKTFSTLITMVYSDEGNSLLEKKNDFPFLTPRTNSWKKNTTEKLNIVFDKISKVLLTKSSYVKTSFLNFASTIIFFLVKKTEHHQFLKIVNKNLFRVPLTLLYDEDDIIRESCIKFTEKVSTSFFQSYQLEEQLIEEFLSFLDDFQGEINCLNDVQIMNNIKLLSGYLNCFQQSKLKLVFSGPNQKERFFDLLIEVYKLDFDKMSCSVLPKELTDFTNSNWFEKKFFYFEEKRISYFLTIIFTLMKKLNDQRFLMDYVLEKLSYNDIKNRSTIFHLISRMIPTFDVNNLNPQIINQIVELLEIELYEIDKENKFIDDRYESIIFCSILIEILTNCCYSLRPDDRPQFFQSSLYTIMACTGSNYLPIQINAKASIIILIKVLNYSSIATLIFDNVDYILSKMLIKINNFNDKENFYHVLEIMFKYTNHNITSHLNIVLNNLLIAMDNNYSLVNFERLAKILSLIIKTFKNWYVILDKTKEKNLFLEKQSNLEFFLNDLTNFLVKRENDEKLLQEFNDLMINNVNEKDILNQQSEIDKAMNEKDQQENKEIQLPLHIDYTKKILEKCSNFLSHKSLEVKLLILDIIIDGLDVLKLHTDSLLPTAHIIWESLIHRFQDEPRVLFKCVICLRILAVHCGDFIKSRTIKQVLPQIYTFLLTNWNRSLITNSTINGSQKDFLIAFNVSKISKNSNAFLFTLNYQLQLLLLEELGKIAFYIKLNDKNLWPLISVLIKYLDEKQPIELRAAAQTSLNLLEKIDNDAVYFFRNFSKQI